MSFPVTENIAKSQRHISFYLACGMPEATPIIFLHGWPELSVSWRHQLELRGCRSSRFRIKMSSNACKAHRVLTTSAGEACLLPLDVRNSVTIVYPNVEHVLWRQTPA